MVERRLHGECVWHRGVFCASLGNSGARAEQRFPGLSRATSYITRDLSHEAETRNEKGELRSHRDVPPPVHAPTSLLSCCFWENNPESCGPMGITRPTAGYWNSGERRDAERSCFFSLRDELSGDRWPMVQDWFREGRNANMVL